MKIVVFRKKQIFLINVDELSLCEFELRVYS